MYWRERCDANRVDKRAECDRVRIGKDGINESGDMGRVDQSGCNVDV